MFHCFTINDGKVVATTTDPASHNQLANDE